MPKVKAIIFDIDGMMIPHTPRFSETYASKYGVSIETVKPFFTGVFQDCLIGKADLKEELAKVADTWRWKGSIDDLLAFWFDSALTPFDDRLFPVIENIRAKGTQAFLATNNEKYRTRDLAEARGLGKHFDKIFSSSAVGHKKPEPGFFEHILKDSGIGVQNCMFWDDDIENVEGARICGLDAHQYKSFEDFEKVLDERL